MLEQAALRDQHGDQPDLDRGADEAAAAQPLDRQPEQCRAADQHDNRDDPPAAARRLAAALAVEPAVEEGDGAAGDDDRVRDMAEERGHVADDAVDGEAGGQQQQRVDGECRHHGAGNLRRASWRVNR